MLYADVIMSILVLAPLLLMSDEFNRKGLAFLMKLHDRLQKKLDEMQKDKEAKTRNNNSRGED